MKKNNKKPLPNIADDIQNGGVYLQHVRCGKSNCKCARGERHSAYYFFTRRNGKLVKTYIRKSEVEAFTRLVMKAKSERERDRQINRSNFDLLKQLRRNLSEKESIIKLLKEEK